MSRVRRKILNCLMEWGRRGRGGGEGAWVPTLNDVCYLTKLKSDRDGGRERERDQIKYSNGSDNPLSSYFCDVDQI